MNMLHIGPRIFALVIVAPLAWWTLDNGKPLEVHSYRLPRDSLDRGANFVVKYDLTFIRRCSGKAQRVWVDSTNTEHKTKPYLFYDGRAGSAFNSIVVPLRHIPDATVQVAVPYSMSPGKATYHNETEFYCNPLQKFTGWGIKFSYPVIPFNVTDGYEKNIEKSTSLFAHEDDNSLQEIPEDNFPNLQGAP